MICMKQVFRQKMWNTLKETNDHPDIYRIVRIHDMVEARIWNNLWSYIYDQTENEIL